MTAGSFRGSQNLVETETAPSVGLPRPLTVMTPALVESRARRLPVAGMASLSRTS